ncbi:antibiotic acetyltransferase [Lutibacter sp. HS1-25]|uniref:CatB-related O-acetyltransferase n=1 Tax=Lutibacter sp. HS1-25 TaxID=2485000 RepID=UPI00101075D1|nr:CatB-related O-acetyltransferase [Lutibacter sp. HS1-25]RXP61845.1 antibiotic acetyltransferase [Lutibacter sp. HS1-25]
MGFGINKILSNYGPLGIARNIKRSLDLRKYKNLNLRLPLKYGISNTVFGKNNCIGESVMISNSKIGDYTYINNNTVIQDTTIGKFCSIGENVRMVLGTHPINFVSTHPAFYSNNKQFKTFSDKTYIEEFKGVTLGNDVWVADGAVIMGGVTIGNGAIVAARSVVTKDVEPFSIVGGVPAKHIKYRFDKETIDKINNLEWWNWDESIFLEKFKIFQDTQEFIKHFSNHK